ncbi:transposase [Pseudomonas juntendi]|nr:transposase [Pseudomonas juntendi]MCO7058659.1 transposase [Pseudomonas juntendi]UJM14921.1 transposase [Pseudomonas juntendi]
MPKQRRTFIPEFKREAAYLVLDQGYSHAEAARSLGLVESALRRWVNQLQQERGHEPVAVLTNSAVSLKGYCSTPTGGHNMAAVNSARDCGAIACARA